MGRPPSGPRTHFVKVPGRKANSTHYFVRCKHCLAAHTARSNARQLQTPTYREPDSLLPKQIVGRIENFKRHLLRYHDIVDTDDPAERPPPLPAAAQPARPRERTRLNDQERHTSTPSAIPLADVYRCMYSPQQQRQFERFLLEFQVALALPDSYVEHPATIRLFQFLNPQCIGSLPSRLVLGGRVLDACAREFVEQSAAALRMVQESTGGRVNFLSDVWQNIVKTHLLDVHLSLFGKVFIEGMHGVGSEHDGVALARQMEELIIVMERNGWNIGVVITDNAGQCGRARRILALRWPKIHFGKCFAHDINNLVRAVLRRTQFYKVADEAAAAVKALNTSTSKWLPRADEVIASTYDLRGNKPLALLTLCDTRWNSMQGCFASLLRVKTALKQFVVKFQNFKDLPRAVRVFGNDTFRISLKAAEWIIRPLCNASYILQRDENTLADVVLCYRDIFDGFVAGSYAEELVELVEERWQDCEQPLFMLALFLYPAHIDTANALPRTDISSVAAACNFAVLYFKRFFLHRDPGQLRDHMSRWCNRELNVEDDEQFSISEFGGDAARYWNYARGMRAGRNLPDLAIAVLSIAANTATCERYFSEVGRIHTPTT